MRSIFLPCLAASAIACGRTPAPNTPRASGPSIQVFTEPAPIAALAATGGALFAGGDEGLDRWDLATGKARRIEGIAAVRALELEGGTLWFLTESGAGKLDVESERIVLLPPPPAPLAAAPAAARAIAPDGKGGLWIGTDSGLYHVDEGGWQPTNHKREVTALHLAANGTLWLGTRDGVVERNAGGVFSTVHEGNTLAVVVALGEGPDGALIAAGKDAQGQDRVAVLSDGTFSTYRLTGPAGDSGSTIAAVGTGVLATPGHLLTLHRPGSTLLDLPKDPVELRHVAGSQVRPPYLIIPTPGLAQEITAVASAGDLAFVGTRTLGTELVTRDGTAHLRGRALVAGARGLSVACAAPGDCYLATGGASAWRFDGHSFRRVRITASPAIALAFVRAPSGDILALYREPSERRLHVARLEKGAFTPRAELQVETPSGATLLSFARFAPDGLLWLGLKYVDADGDERPYGVALVNLDLNAVSYHREADKKVGVLPVPNDVVAVAFHGDETWFASGSGAARMQGEKLRLWTEADDLKSEILHGVVVTDAGRIFIASTSGVGEFDGAGWKYPKKLAVVTNAIAGGPGGRLWLGTERGLMVYDGKKTARYDRRAGLLDDRVFDVAVDESGRVWTRGLDGLSLVTP